MSSRSQGQSHVPPAQPRWRAVAAGALAAGALPGCPGGPSGQVLAAGCAADLAPLSSPGADGPGMAAVSGWLQLALLGASQGPCIPLPSRGLRVCSRMRCGSCAPFILMAPPRTPAVTASCGSSWPPGASEHRQGWSMEASAAGEGHGPHEPCPRCPALQGSLRICQAEEPGTGWGWARALAHHTPALLCPWLWVRQEALRWGLLVLGRVPGPLLEAREVVGSVGAAASGREGLGSHLWEQRSLAVWGHRA